MSNDDNLGLKAVVLVLDKFGAGREMEHIYVYNFGVGQKSGVAHATGATASLAPLGMNISRNTFYRGRRFLLMLPLHCKVISCMGMHFPTLI